MFAVSVSKGWNSLACCEVCEVCTIMSTTTVSTSIDDACYLRLFEPTGTLCNQDQLIVGVVLKIPTLDLGLEMI